MGGVYERGLLAELIVTLEEWYAVAERALRTWPLERVTVADVPEIVDALVTDQPVKRLLLIAD